MRREAKYAFVGGVVILSGAIVWVVLNNRESEPLANLPRDLTSGVGPTEALAAHGNAKPDPNISKEQRLANASGVPGENPGHGLQPHGATNPRERTDAGEALGVKPADKEPPTSLGTQTDHPNSDQGVLLPRVPQLVAEDKPNGDAQGNPQDASHTANSGAGATPDAPIGTSATPDPGAAHDPRSSTGAPPSTLSSDVNVPARSTESSSPPVSPPVAPADTKYTVAAGDTLSSIADAHYGDAKHWPRIAAANPGINPNVLKTGQSLVLPPLRAAEGPAASDANRKSNAAASGDSAAQRSADATAPTGADQTRTPPAPREAATVAHATYTVAEGDTLTTIARNVLKDGSRWREIFQLNRDKLSTPDVVVPGTVLKMPAPKPVRGPEHG